MPVAWPVELEPGVLEQHGEIGRLLELDEEDPFPDRMRQPGGHVDAIAGHDPQLVERGQHRVAVLALDPPGDDVLLHVLPEPEVHRRVVRLEDQPGLGLAGAEAEMLARELAVGMTVDREPLARVEELDEQRRIGPEPAHVGCAEEVLGRGRDRVAERAAVREQREPAAVGAEPARGGADPVLGRVGVLRRDPPEARDSLASPVEVVELVGAQSDRPHGRISPDPRSISHVGRTIRWGGLVSPARRSRSSLAAWRPSSAAS